MKKCGYHFKDLIMYLNISLGLFVAFLLVENIWMLEAKKLTFFIMINLRFSDRCSYSGEGVLLLVQSGFFRQVLLFEGVLLIVQSGLFRQVLLFKGVLLIGS